jgi:hypothetical protein
MRSLLLVLGAIALASSVRASVSAQTRAEADSANPLRRCGPARYAGEASDLYAVRCAEHFVAQQGYTDLAPVADMSAIVPEGIEWGASKLDWLAVRRGTLDRRAAGVCVDTVGKRFTVVFRSASGRSARAVTMDATFGSLRVQHQDFRFEVVEAEQYGCRQVGAL